jgi:uncharacterized protein (TIGR00290 family)
VKARTVMAFSGGKDSSYALWRLMQDDRYEVGGLLTTLTEGYDRISMQGVRRSLLDAQAEALGLPLYPAYIPQKASNEVYERAMGAMVQRLVAGGFTACAFGDLFLEDVRAYRERMLTGSGLDPVFPIWGEDTGRLAHRLIEDGFRAVITCVDPEAVPASLAGREFDEALLAELPPGTDPCAERGEFHTFVYDAPHFAYPISFARGEVVERDGFVFADLIPA